MHQRNLVQEAWKQAGLYKNRDPKLTEFLQTFDAMSTACWKDCAKLVRGRYAKHLDAIVKPLWESGDKLLRLNLIRLADTADKTEHGLLDWATTQCDPAKDEHELRALMHTGCKSVVDYVINSKKTPDFLLAAAKALRKKI